MSCERCESYATTVPVRGPAELERVVACVRQAVADGALECAAFEGEPSLLTIDLAGQLPDVMRCRLQCAHCGQPFALAVDTYHGIGGSWRMEV